MFKKFGQIVTVTALHFVSSPVCLPISVSVLLATVLPVPYFSFQPSNLITYFSFYVFHP